MNRRDFLRFASVSASVAAVDFLTPDHAVAASTEVLDLKIVETKGFSMLQGLTTETSTQFSVDVPQKMAVHYQIMDAATGRFFDPCFIKSVSRKSSKWRVDKIGYIDLPYLGKFVFRVLDDKGNVLDERNLALLDTQKKDARFAFISCMFDGNLNYKKMWPLVEKSDCDLFFFIGDNCYGDILLTFDGPTLLWNRYIETRRKLPFYHWKNLKPVLCTWDDHDYGLNNAKGNYKHKHESLKTFNAFSAQEPIADCFDRGPGISCFFKAFGQKFVILDGRFFRKLPYDGIVGYLGKEQMDWAFAHMSFSNEPNWVVQGSQFFMGQSKKNESYINDSPQELAIFTNRISQLNSPSVFVAGDVHYSDVFHAPRSMLGYNTIEIASSCLHSVARLSLPKNPDRICGAVKENFVVVNLIPTSNDMVFNLTCVGIKKICFDNQFSV